MTFVMACKKLNLRVNCMRERVRVEVKRGKCVNVLSVGSGYRTVTSPVTLGFCFKCASGEIDGRAIKSGGNRRRDQRESRQVLSVWNNAVLLQHDEAPGELQAVVRPRRWAMKGTERSVA